MAVVTAAASMPQRRGLAIGLAVAGTSVGGMLIPPLVTQLIQNQGWRQTLQQEVLVPTVMFVLIALLLKNKAVGKSKSSPGEPGLPYSQAVRRPQFYLIAAAGGLTFYAILALFSHLFLFMRWLEFSPTKASFGYTALSLAALLGKIAAGYLSDKSSPYILLRVNMCVMLAGLIGIYVLPQGVWIFLVITGLGWGALHTLYNYVLIALFGMRAAGKINATVAIFQSAGAGLGAALTGYLFDATSSYVLPFAVASGVLACALVFTLFLQPLSQEASTARTP